MAGGGGGTGHGFLRQCRRGTGLVDAGAVPHLGASGLEQTRVTYGRHAALVHVAAVGLTCGIGSRWALYKGWGIATSNMAGRGRGGGQLIRDPDINRLDQSHDVAGAIGFQGCGRTGVASE
ncbi:hypothetical protein PIB30_086062 [Stylosanthes scabra]|uniref:Uncharacterized protein n=1 Tax=Stylosanthes scabra TaxID=79078 RepID=A0ABU6VWN8_9FABA|nr:hypothetical protein [Stylosanthes scabra]